MTYKLAYVIFLLYLCRRNMSRLLYNIMRKYPSWSEFAYKYSSEEEQRARFEDLARCLFCHRFHIPYGIYQAVNHIGNETEVICRDGEIIGFQAKFFKRSIQKEQIIESIEKAKRENPSQTKMILYTNLSFGAKNKTKRTNVQNDIAAYALTKGLEIEWSTDKMILDQVAGIEWIYDVFFSVDSIYATLYAAETKNTESILNPIESEINFQGKRVKVPRTSLLSQLKDKIAAHTHCVIYGEGGCGKTALVKDLYTLLKDENIPVCIRKAQSLKVNKIDEIFQYTKNYTIDEFLNLYHDTPAKVFVIDSAERLQEIDDNEPIYNLLKYLAGNGWSLVFTVRNVYWGDLCDDLKMTYRLDYETFSIDTISEAELDRYADELQITLPKNKNFKQRLCNLFHLRFYLQYYASIKQDASYQVFISHVWDEKVIGHNRQHGYGLEREICYLQIVRARMNSSDFFLDESDFSPRPLSGLISDEVIGQTASGIFITHDIYEEWGIYKIIEKEWSRKKDIPQFFGKIGTSYVARRTFRQWLSDKLNNNQTHELQEITHYALSPVVAPLWRDEIIVSILMSAYCEVFFKDAESILLEHDSPLLERVAYLLLVACKRISKIISIEGAEYPLYEPYGYGWAVMIQYIYQHRDNGIRIPYMLKILTEWTVVHVTGNTTRLAGLIALDILKKEEYDSQSYYVRRDEETLFAIIANSASEIKAELTLLLGNVVKNKWCHHNDPYYDFSIFILTQNRKALNIVVSVPHLVLRLAEMMWIYEEENKPLRVPYYIDEVPRFGIRKTDGLHDYSPEGALQTPVYSLLCINTAETLQFVVRFVNHCVEEYIKHPYGESYGDLETLEMHLPDNSTVKLWGAYWLWQMYRGAIHFAIPDLLTSVHMALEKYLLDLADNKSELAKPIFDYIFKQSRSVSLIAVVSSVVMAYPERYYKYALVLFGVIDFFHYDNIRLHDESHLDWFINMGAMQNKEVAKERIASKALKHRHSSLELLCTRYQYVQTEELSEEESESLIKQVHKVLDDNWAYVDSLSGREKDTKSLILYRIDRRTHNPQMSDAGNGQVIIELSPKLPQELKKRSEEVISSTQKSMRFGSLHVWVHKKLHHKDTAQYPQYDNVSSAMEVLRDLLHALQTQEELMPMDEWVAYATAGILIRDNYSELAAEDRTLCESLIKERITSALDRTYYPQIDDGLECCVHAIPQLISNEPDNEQLYVTWLYDVLCNTESIGQYKRVCDYAIEAIHEGKLWQIRYLQLLHLINRFREDYIMRDAKKGVNKTEYAEIIAELIPCDTTDNTLQQVILDLIPYLNLTLAGKRNETYYRTYYLYRAYARFVINRSIEDVDKYITPILGSLRPNSEFMQLLLAFFYAEDYFKRPDVFWKIWKLLYPVIISLQYGYDDNVISAYMLIHPNALHDEHHWDSFRKQDTWLYAELAKDFGGKPIVLWAIAKALNGISHEYIRDGIDWLYVIIHNQKNLNLRDMQNATIFYLEQALNVYIRQNMKYIRQNNSLRIKLLEILTFMSEHESVMAYMLRERV